MLQACRCIFLLPLLTVFAVPCESCTVAAEPNQDPLAKRTRYAAILADARIDGNPYLAVLDTGNSHSLVQADSVKAQFSEYRSRKISIEIFGEVVEKPLYLAVPVSVGNSPEIPLDILKTDLTLFPSFKSWRIDGAIGMDYLRNCVLRIDGNERGAAIFPRSPVTHQGQRVPISFRIGLPYVKLSLAGGSSLEALVDTGKDDYLNLPPDVIRQLTKLGHSRPATNETRFTARGAIPTKSHILRWVEFANVRFENIQVREAQRAAIGLAMLENLNSVFDFPSHECWIEPLRSSQGILCEPDASGLVVAFGPDHRALVRRLISGFPAEKTTIAVGDELLAINGRSSQELSYRAIARELSRTGTTARLVLKSSNTTYEIEFKLDRPYEFPPRWAPEDSLPKAKFLPDAD